MECQCCVKFELFFFIWINIAKFKIPYFIAVNVNSLSVSLLGGLSTKFSWPLLVGRHLTFWIAPCRFAFEKSAAVSEVFLRFILHKFAFEKLIFCRFFLRRSFLRRSTKSLRSRLNWRTCPSRSRRYGGPDVWLISQSFLANSGWRVITRAFAFHFQSLYHKDNCSV